MLLVSIEEAAYARPLKSWRPLAADVDPPAVALCLAAVVGLIAVFDASLKGIGVLWYAACADGSRRLIAGAALDIQSLCFGSDASFQNTAEYIAATCAVRGAKMLRDEGLLIDGKPPAGLCLHGDSLTALNWARKGRVKGELAINASIVAVMQSATADMPLLGDEHLPAVLNPHSDLTSRQADSGLTLAQLIEQSDHMRGMRVLDLGMEDILPLCDPRKALETEDDFGSFWAAVRAAFQ